MGQWADNEMLKIRGCRFRPACHEPAAIDKKIKPNDGKVVGDLGVSNGLQAKGYGFLVNYFSTLKT